MEAAVKKTVDDCVGELYAALFRLREARKLQEEYDAMGAVISMLTTDRQFLRQRYAGKIKI